MKKRRLLFIMLAILSAPVSAFVPENMQLSLGEVVLKPRGQQTDAALMVKTLTLPALCPESTCWENSTITLYDGTPLMLKAGTTRYQDVLKGIDLSLTLSGEHVERLRSGQGGNIEVAIRQGKKPYHTGPFSFSLLSYSGDARLRTEGIRVEVNLDGTVGSGSCEITGGRDLRFMLASTQAELRQLGRSRKLVGSQNIDFDCVNVSGITLRFSSPDTRQGEQGVLYDDNTGVGVILGYTGGGKKGDIFWDKTEIDLPVAGDALSVAISLYALGSGQITPGGFTFTGIYEAEYN